MLYQHLRIYSPECHEDDPWDVFIADEDERDPMPEPGDFWSDDDRPFTDVDGYEDRLQACQGEVPQCSR
jgi:hypothetical protein